MSFFQRLLKQTDRFVSVPSTDPDDARRRKLLNIILFGVAVLVFVTLIVTLFLEGLKVIATDLSQLVLLSSLALLIGTLVFYLINRSRRIPGWVASNLFLIFLTIMLTFTDTPEELANGRSLFVFTIPIIMASILTRPAFSFLFAAITTGLITYLALIAEVEPNTFAAVGFFLVAFVAWLSARSLEQTLRELRTINADLDQVVAQRTQALLESLSRERVQAGRNQAILDSIADGVIVFDPHGRAIMANPAIGELTGIPLEYVVSTDIMSWLNLSKLSASNRSTIAAMIENPETQVSNFRIEWEDKTLSVSAAQVRDAEGTSLGTVAVFRDFTHEAEIERMKSTIIAIVSHELRTPLNAILGYAEMLMEMIYGPLNEKQQGATTRILTNSKRLLSIVSDLLDQAQMEAGKLTIQMRPVKPSELIEGLHAVMDQIAVDKGLQLTSELDPGLPGAVTGDPARLQQVLVNLTNNAVKYTETGSVHVRLLKLDEQHWGLEVADTGRGIPEEALPYIFELFRQVEGTVTRDKGGVGLGLSIVKQLVQLMGGEIRVKSKVGTGSIFLVSLPMIVPEEIKQ